MGANHKKKPPLLGRREDYGKVTKLISEPAMFIDQGPHSVISVRDRSGRDPYLERLQAQQYARISLLEAKAK